MARATTLLAVEDALAKVLRDAPIRDAVLIGSAVYAPELARELDVVVTAEHPDEVRDALRVVMEDATGRAVDVIARRPGEETGTLALAILAGVVLAGNGQTIRDAKTSFDRGGGMENSFRQANASLADADELLETADRKVDADDRLRWQMRAFDALFHSARVAALCYLGRDTAAWGGVDKALPPPFAEQFQAMTRTLHIQYGYEGRIPQSRVTAEFEAWKAQVRVFVDAVRQRVLEREGQGPDG